MGGKTPLVCSLLFPSSSSSLLPSHYIATLHPLEQHVPATKGKKGGGGGGGGAKGCELYLFSASSDSGHTAGEVERGLALTACVRPRAGDGVQGVEEGMSLCVISEDKKEGEGARQGRSLSVHLEAVLMVDSTERLHEVAGKLDLVFKSQLEEAQSLIESLEGEEEKEEEEIVVKAFHFVKHGGELAVHMRIVRAESGEEWKEEGVLATARRKAFQQSLGMTLERPRVRVGQAIDVSRLLADFGEEGQGKFHTLAEAHCAYHLRNVHVGVAPSGVRGGRLSLVRGDYAYHHYMQDNFDDKGWGCAYRSLQTIISWYRSQCYTTAPVPSHREIQRRLEQMGDKPKGFLGSREWIGAIELGLLVEDITGVQYKIMNLPSGRDLSKKGRELSAHFETQGTPIMIGGGFLAYTLLGVDYNEDTGEIAFLILDPHYTGTEDLKTIHKQRWCGWRKGPTEDGPGDIFDANSFYNLMMPQCPNVV